MGESPGQSGGAAAGLGVDPERLHPIDDEGDWRQHDSGESQSSEITDVDLTQLAATTFSASSENWFIVQTSPSRDAAVSPHGERFSWEVAAGRPFESARWSLASPLGCREDRVDPPRYVTREQPSNPPRS